MSKHIFPNTEIPYEKRSVIEFCELCGVKTKRFLSGNRVYIDENDTIVGKLPDCIGSSVKQETYKVIAKPLSTIIEETKNIIIPKASLSPTEAALKDSLMMIKLLYADMVTHGLNTQSKMMAGRFLYSQGYEELCKELESKNKI